MGTVLVVGGGPVGLATAMLLARDGHDVTVLERDAAAPPETATAAWESWERAGVAQFRQVHFFHAKLLHLLNAEFPDVRDELVRLGARRFNILDALPQSVMDRAPRPGDERFDTLNARRAVTETAFARVADATPGVKIARGVTVEGPIARDGDDIPRVIGVRTRDHGDLFADLVVDAMGRRSKFGEWVTGIGGRAPIEEASDSGFAYYTRHYRSADGSLPEFKGGIVAQLSTFMVLTAPTDNGMWAIATVCMAGDTPMKAIRDNAVWERVVRGIPNVAHWIDAEPVHDVLPMAGAMDRYRRFVVDDRPVVTGLVAVGDSWACTNPTAGRGLPLGIGQAIALRDVARESFDDPERLALGLDEVTERSLTPWYRQQMERDRTRAAGIRAVLEGREPTIEDTPLARMQQAFVTAAAHDADIARAFLEMMSVLTLPGEIMMRPGMIDAVLAASAGKEPLPFAEPSRERLLELLG